jgi:hypothetical protein
MDSGREGRMTEERVPRRDFLKVTAGTALTFGAGLPATAQTSASAPPSPPFSTAQPAEFILKNAKVITVDANFSIAQAIAIAGERSSPSARMRQWRRMPHRRPASSI